jgi:hypothetical protein
MNNFLEGFGDELIKISAADSSEAKSMKERISETANKARSKATMTAIRKGPGWKEKLDKKLESAKRTAKKLGNRAANQAQREITSGSKNGDDAAFDIGNRTATQYAKAYGRGAMRAVGLDPDKDSHKAGAVGGAVGLRMAMVHGKHKRMRALEKKVGKMSSSGGSKTISTLGKILRRGR